MLDRVNARRAIEPDYADDGRHGQWQHGQAVSNLAVALEGEDADDDFCRRAGGLLFVTATCFCCLIAIVVGIFVVASIAARSGGLGVGGVAAAAGPGLVVGFECPSLCESQGMLGRGDIVFVRPGDLLLQREAAAIPLPAFLGRLAAAGAILAGVGNT